MQENRQRSAPQVTALHELIMRLAARQMECSLNPNEVCRIEGAVLGALPALCRAPWRRTACDLPSLLRWCVQHCTIPPAVVRPALYNPSCGGASSIVQKAALSETRVLKSEENDCPATLWSWNARRCVQRGGRYRRPAGRDQRSQGPRYWSPFAPWVQGEGRSWSGLWAGCGPGGPTWLLGRWVLWPVIRPRPAPGLAPLGVRLINSLMLAFLVVRGGAAVMGGGAGVTGVMGGGAGAGASPNYTDLRPPNRAP
jgi:hypothetical protein